MPGKTAATEVAEPACHISRRAVLGAAASLTFLVALKSPALALPRGDRRLVLFNPHTGEGFDDVYWCDDTYVEESLQRINWLMRDFHRDQVAAIDPDLLDLLHKLAGQLETDRPFHILSGYRTEYTNRLLKSEGRAPAAHSEHLLGKAADIRIDGVRYRYLRRAAVALKAGGVGTYPSERFIHVDVGPVREWSERT